MRHYGKNFWKTVPFLRLLIPLVAGILLGFYCAPPLSVTIVVAVMAAAAGIVLQMFSIRIKFRLQVWNGIIISIIFICAGILLAYRQDIRNNKNWIGYHYRQTNTTIRVTLTEPLTPKKRSQKTLATLEAILETGAWKKVQGKILLYFSEDNPSEQFTYGSRLVIRCHLQAIANTGNPGGFDYRRYCAFQDIYYQAYLRKNDFINTGAEKNTPGKLLFSANLFIRNILKKYIPGKQESGVAEALLIGYRNDLDKDLVQAYSNTGVVHIIAISGLHLGMIYGLLVALMGRLPKTSITRFIKPLIILLVLWSFSLLTGAAASILRSAVMFSFIVLGECLGRKTQVYNTLAASAFCMLVYNPYFLWDAGFLLSYTAVISIIVFMQPVYRCIYIKNKILNAVWQLNAVTLSAQILTLPILLYLFHQFPNLFLFTNGVAVPLSGIILYAELILLIVFPIPYLNYFTGKTISFLLAQMDGYIARTARLPFSVTDHIDLSLLQTILLYIALSAFAVWLMKRRNQGLITGLVSFSLCLLITTTKNIRLRQQQKLIIYHLPKYQVIDIFEGTRFQTLSNPAPDLPATGFYLQPARIAYHVTPSPKFEHTLLLPPLIATQHKQVLIIDHWRINNFSSTKIPVDLIILSGNPPVSIGQLSSVFTCTQYVFDSSNPLWKIHQWKKEADSLHLRHHATSEQGAFEVNL